MKIVIPDSLKEVFEDASRRVATKPEYLLAPELQAYRARKRKEKLCPICGEHRA